MKKEGRMPLLSVQKCKVDEFKNIIGVREKWVKPRVCLCVGVFVCVCLCVRLLVVVVVVVVVCVVL